MRLSEFPDRGKAGLRDRLDPFSGIKPSLHDYVPDDLVRVDAEEHDFKRRVENEMRQIDQRDHHEEHEGNLHHASESRVASGAEEIVLLPVPHADHRNQAVIAAQEGTDREGFSGQSNRGKERTVQRHHGKADHGDDCARKVDDPESFPIGLLMVSGTDFISDNDGSRACEPLNKTV